MYNFDIFISTVRIAIPHLNVYIVGDNSPSKVNMLACRGDNSSGLLLQGSQSLSVFPVGTKVIVTKVPGMLDIGIILAAVPFSIESDVNLIRSLEMRAQVGLKHDDAYNVFLPGGAKTTQGNIPNLSNGTPIDSLPGDWGYITDSGLFVMLGSLRASLGASSFCKMDFFALDELARLSVWNYEHRGPSLDHRILDDGGEYNEIRMLSPTTWEGAGNKNPGNSFDQKEGGFKDKDAFYEPFTEDQQGIFKSQIFKGYLGNGSKEYVATLSDTALSGDFLTYKDKSPYIGLLEISKGLNGAYSIKSAKDITLEKTIIIPVPKELIIPEDALGDNPDNYKAAGVVGGSGEAPDMEEYATDLTPAEKIAALYDYHAYVYNKYNIAAFIAHEKDWHMPEEDSGDNSVKYNLNFANTGIYKPGVLGAFKYAPPVSGTLTIDGRKNHVVKYYVSRSIIKQLDDGSIVIEAGYGEQIILGQGNIMMSCPGDIFQLPGRSAVTWAPKDVIQRAGSSVDVTAAKGDVRLKAEKNLHMLGGNSGIGGILIESKGKGKIQKQNFDKLGELVNAPGIIIKATESDAYLYGKSEVYIGLTEDTGSIVIDAKEGNILSTAAQKIDSLKEASVTIIADSNLFVLGAESGIFSGNLITDTLVVASKDKSSVAISGGLFVEDAIVTLGQVLAVKVIASEAGAISQPVKKGSISTPAGKIKTAVDEGQNRAEEIKNTITESVDSLVETLIASEESPANAEVIKSVAFSLRTKDDYDIGSDFALAESRWQQLYRADGATTVWVEPVVDTNGEETMPYPGKEAWQEQGDAFITTDLNNFDILSGFSKPRDNISADKPTINKLTLSAGYLVTKQKT